MASWHFVLYVHSPVFLWLISTQIFAHLYQHQACWYLHELQDFCLDMQVHQLQCCWCSVQCLFHSNNGILNILGDRSVTSNDLRFRSVTSNRNSWKEIDKLELYRLDGQKWRFWIGRFRGIGHFLEESATFFRGIGQRSFINKKDIRKWQNRHF